MAVKVTPQMCKYCFDVVVNKLKNVDPPPYMFDPEVECGGLFVTWKIQNGSGGYEMKGCIGELQPMKLKDLEEYAKQAGFEDYRYRSITLDDIPKLKCTVSLLYDYEKAKNVYDWEVGKHGVFLQFKDCGEDFEATYLPEVPKKKGWSVEDTVKELITKSGYKKEMTKELLDSTETHRYKSDRLSVSYEEYTKL